MICETCSLPMPERGHPLCEQYERERVVTKLCIECRMTTSARPDTPPDQVRCSDCRDPDGPLRPIAPILRRTPALRPQAAPEPKADDLINAWDPRPGGDAA